MRWPDIFFKVKKRREESSSSKPSTNSPKLAGEPVQVIKPAFASTAVKSEPAPEKPAVESFIQPPVVTPPPAISPVATPAPVPSSEKVSDDEDSFILPPAGASADSTDAAQSGALSGQLPLASLLVTANRRKAKLTDVARIITPPPSEKPKDQPAPEPEIPAAVSPPAFPVAASAGNVFKPGDGEGGLLSSAASIPGTPAENKIDPAPVENDFFKPQSSPPETKPDAPVLEKPIAPEPAAATTSAQASKPEPPKPEVSTASVPVEHLPAVSGERKEFLLTNGERIFGRVLSESDDVIYLSHDTLGVLTLPRVQIAKRLIEIILINGDRVVGDIMAETPDTLYVRHASLGMLTVPRAQRSTRVVEAILKDGDRILGEVLAETDAYTVIRSATLGTVTVPHDKVSMLNRKLEQVELKSLPNAAPELKDKPSA